MQQQTEVNFADLFQSMPDGLIALSIDGLVQKANPAACSILGYEEAELVDRPLSDIFAKDGADASARAGRAYGFAQLDAPFGQLSLLHVKRLSIGRLAAVPGAAPLRFH